MTFDAPSFAPATAARPVDLSTAASLVQAFRAHDDIAFDAAVVVVSFTNLLCALPQEFFEAPQRVLLREHPRRRIQGMGSQVKAETMNTHVHRLRRHLQAQRVFGISIDAVRGRAHALRCSATAMIQEQPLPAAELTRTSNAAGAAFA
jgi:DNA-binding response OmpR family regulator